MTNKKIATPQPSVPLETVEQQALITWVDTFHMSKGKNLFAIPNGGSRHPVEAIRLRAEGVRPGVADLFYAEARGSYHGLFIEMKRRNANRTGQLEKVIKGGQEGFMKRVRLNGYCYRVGFGAAVAKEILLWYWALPEAQQPVLSDSDRLLML